jgi:pimeloyl-ACP methyl ester carboxylesterase
MGVDCPSGRMREKPLCSRHLPALPATFRMSARNAAEEHRFFSIPPTEQVISSRNAGTCMRRFASFRASLLTLTVLGATMPAFSRAVDAIPLQPEPAASPSNIVIGFVGGFVAHNDRHHGPVQFAAQIQRVSPKDTYVRVFENRHRKQAYAAVLRLLDTNRDGVLSAEEKARAHIILFGHSWGASAAVSLARDLRRQGVPVLLTVQIDSVAKIWQNDSLIPDNVAEAVNFYQPNGIIHGRRRITAANPAKTEILGNYRVDYEKNPIQCPEASWAERIFIPGHMESECDPHTWSQIETMVRQRLIASYTSSAAPAAVSDDLRPQH